MSRGSVIPWCGCVVLVLAVGTAGVSRSAGLERLLMPGPLAAAHADLEDDCENCHRAFDAGAEDDLCTVCHEAVGLDVAAGAGLHGRLRSQDAQTCRSCHPDHRGRKADVRGLDRETFSHHRTDFTLEGAHLRLACAACHEEGEPRRTAPTDCATCHRDDDPHRGAMGPRCEDCHASTHWRGGTFDHSETRFSLEGAHRTTACGLCHPSEVYEETPSDCAACHGTQDVHERRFGTDCATCHRTTEWKKAAFDHDARTDFRLTGAHATTACDGCHAGAGVGPADTLDASCSSCHASDDDHDGQNGSDCGRCHGTRAWKKTRFDHGRDAGWPLRDAHRRAPCEGCHRAAAETVALSPDCADCHGADDAHRGQLGVRCESCHGEASWLGDVRFDHDMTSFPLLGLHATASCSDCHDGSTFQDAERTCVGCHGSRDVHEQRLGPDCRNCHNPNGWEIWRFDHDRQTAFALHGAHDGLDCLACHSTPVEARVRLSSSCGECHALDDAHRGSFGSRCGDCHGSTTWRGARIPR